MDDSTREVLLKFGNFYHDSLHNQRFQTLIALLCERFGFEIQSGSLLK